MQTNSAEPDTDRFLADLDALRHIGAFKAGVHRPTYSAPDMESRHWLMQCMVEAGLDPEMDGIGNVLGRHPGPGPKLLSGSHIESQNEAGWLYPVQVRTRKSLGEMMRKLSVTASQ